MLEINLLPAGLRKRRQQIELPDISFLPVAGVFAAALAGIYLLLALAATFQGNRLSRLEAEWQGIAPQKLKVDRVKKRLTAMERKVNAIDDLMESRPLWSARLKALSDSMMQGVWLRRLWIETRRETVQIPAPAGAGDKSGAKKPAVMTKISRFLHLEGSVAAAGGEETAAIGRFIRSLKSNDDFFRHFSEIGTGSIQRTTFNDVEVMNFDLIASFKEGVK